jgi:hypothetical protein
MGCQCYHHGVGLGMLLLGGVLQSGVAMAQSLPACQPPRPDEYLLLVLNQQTETQPQLQQLLPENAVLTPCNYLNTSVVRVEGFASTDIATAWAQYLATAAGVQAYVARPASPASIGTTPAPTGIGGTSSPVPTASPANAAVPSASPASPAAAASPTYNPQPLGAGYAVLVHYFNRPELAASVRQITSRDVGLVAFEQQPYLLATHTTDASVASSVLRTLSEQGLTAAIVDGRRAMLLTPTVK